jgi:hypothetical protein
MTYSWELSEDRQHAHRLDPRREKLATAFFKSISD